MVVSQNKEMEKIYCNKNWFVDFLIMPKYRIYRHLLVLTYAAVLFYDPEKPKEFSGSHQFFYDFTWIFFYLLMVYINMYVLVPKLLFRAKYFSYLLSLIIMIVSGYLFIKRILIEDYFDQYRIATLTLPRATSVFREIVGITNLFVLLVFSSTSIKLFQQWSRDTNRINELEKNSLQIELRELKNQINPHFLFNMLNNVNVLVRKNPDKASLVILKLSDFLRYQLYDNNQQEVLLLSEIQFLKDFMGLENIRRDDFSFSITVENESSNKEQLSQLLLSPNLFTTFVENAIKHSADPDNPSKVKIVFSVYDESLVFLCENTKPQEPLFFGEDSGLGLVNVKRRLELLYGNNFDLEMENLKKTFKVTLKIPV